MTDQLTLFGTRDPMVRTCKRDGCGQTFVRLHNRQVYCSGACRMIVNNSVSSANLRRQREAREAAKPERLCRLAACEVTFKPSQVSSVYCCADHRDLGYRRPELRRGSTFTRVLCISCRKPSKWSRSTERRRWAEALWPFMCKECWEPLNSVRSNLRKHSVPIEQVLRLRDNPVCDLCGTDLLVVRRVRKDRPNGDNGEFGKRELSIDHDHSCCHGPYGCSRCFRGFLCSRHNLGIGLFHDSPEELSAAATYLSPHRFSPEHGELLGRQDHPPRPTTETNHADGEGDAGSLTL